MSMHRRYDTKSYSWDLIAVARDPAEAAALEKAVRSSAQKGDVEAALQALKTATSRPGEVGLGGVRELLRWLLRIEENEDEDEEDDEAFAGGEGAQGGERKDDEEMREEKSAEEESGLLHIIRDSVDYEPGMGDNTASIGSKGGVPSRFALLLQKRRIRRRRHRLLTVSSWNERIALVRARAFASLALVSMFEVASTDTLQVADDVSPSPDTAMPEGPILRRVVSLDENPATARREAMPAPAAADALPTEEQAVCIAQHIRLYCERGHSLPPLTLVGLLKRRKTRAQLRTWGIHLLTQALHTTSYSSAHLELLSHLRPAFRGFAQEEREARVCAGVAGYTTADLQLPTLATRILSGDGTKDGALILYLPGVLHHDVDQAANQPDLLACRRRVHHPTTVSSLCYCWLFSPTKNCHAACPFLLQFLEGIDHHTRQRLRSAFHALLTRQFELLQACTSENLLTFDEELSSLLLWNMSLDFKVSMHVCLP